MGPGIQAGQRGDAEQCDLSLTPTGALESKLHPLACNSGFLLGGDISRLLPRRVSLDSRQGVLAFYSYSLQVESLGEDVNPRPFPFQ